MQSIYEQYAILESKIAALEAEKEQMRPEIIQNMVEVGVEKVETAVGKFSLSKRKVWNYPDYVKEAEDEFKAIKAKSESTGDATYEEAQSLRFTSIKI